MFEKLKKAFGFGAPDDIDGLLTDENLVAQNATSPFVYETDAPATTEVPDVDETVSEIFEHVVKQFNSALPDFLRNTVDAEKEKKQLYESLSTDIKTHLANLQKQVSHQVDEAWRGEREKLQAELKNVSRTAKDIEAKRNELRSQQLSADRQKRAMTERIHELEKQLLSSEAEKEQLELENKSMVNKVKVAQVYEKDMEAMREEINRLQSELTKKRVDSSTSHSDESPSALEAEVLKKIETLEKDNTDLKARNEELSKIEEEYNILVDKFGQVEAHFQKIDEINASKDAKIKTLKEQLDESRKSLKQKEKDLEEAAKRMKELQSTNNTELSADETPVDGSTEVAAVIMEDDDDILNDTDWIVQPTAAKNLHSQRKNDRGKNKKNPRSDDGQMSLW